MGDSITPKLYSICKEKAQACTHALTITRFQPHPTCLLPSLDAHYLPHRTLLALPVQHILLNYFQCEEVRHGTQTRTALWIGAALNLLHKAGFGSDKWHLGGLCSFDIGVNGSVFGLFVDGLLREFHLLGLLWVNVYGIRLACADDVC